MAKKKPEEFYTTDNEFNDLEKYGSLKDALEDANEGDTILHIQVTEVGIVEKSIKILAKIFESKEKSKGKKKKGRKK